MGEPRGWGPQPWEARGGWTRGWGAWEGWGDTRGWEGSQGAMGAMAWVAMDSVGMVVLEAMD